MSNIHIKCGCKHVYFLYLEGLFIVLYRPHKSSILSHQLYKSQTGGLASQTMRRTCNKRSQNDIWSHKVSRQPASPSLAQIHTQMQRVMLHHWYHIVQTSTGRETLYQPDAYEYVFSLDNALNFTDQPSSWRDFGIKYTTKQSAKLHFTHFLCGEVAWHMASRTVGQ